MASFLSRLFSQGSATAAWLEIGDLRDTLAAGDPVVLIDVRQPDKYASGHIPGAINLPLPELPSHTAEIAVHGKPVVLICKTDRRSARAAEILTAAGVLEVAVLSGGTDGWDALGHDLDR